MKSIRIINSNTTVDECGTWIHADMNDQTNIPNVRGRPMKTDSITNILYYDMGNKVYIFLRT